MKIAMFTDTFVQPNGAARHVREVSEELSKSNKVTVYTGSGDSDSYTVVNLPHYSFPLQKEYEFIHSYPDFHADCDVAHAHSPFCTARLAFGTGKPVVTTTHTIPEHLLSYIGMDSLKPLGWRYLMRFHNKSDHVICQTPSTKELFLRHGLNKPVSVISTGLDVGKFENADPKRFREKYSIDGDFVLSANRLSPEKRPNWIFRACKELGIPCVATSVGPCMKKYEKEFPEVRFLGKIPFKDVYDAYSAASVFALTSKVETEGIVVNEAMAAKVPIITSNLPCVTDSIRDEENGFTFSKYPEFKEKLETLWNDGQLRKKFSSKAFSEVKEKDYGIVAKKLLFVYESLV